MKVKDDFVLEKEWIKQAEDDLAVAGKSCVLEEYGWANFQIQQSIEKALKAVLIKVKKELLRTHDLVYLGKLVGLPKNFIEACKKITLFYVSTRYPDIMGKSLNVEETKGYLAIAEKILEWAKKKI